MKRFLIILSSILLIVTLTTFNPNFSNTGFNFFKIKKIQITNLNILNKNNIKKTFNEEFINSNLLFLDNKKIDKILDKYRLIDYLKFKKIYPSKLQIIVYEKETIAIINYKKKSFYLTKNGEEIKFFKNSRLEKLPNIFGKQKNFLEIYSVLVEIDFPMEKIKSFYHFDIGRWDIILQDNKVIKLPVKNFADSLKNYIDLRNKINFEKYSIFDYRIKDQLILN